MIPKELREKRTNPSRKGKDMTAMNRFSLLDRERFVEAQLDEQELGLGCVHPSIDKQKREHCVLNTQRQ